MSQVQTAATIDGYCYGLYLEQLIDALICPDGDTGVYIGGQNRAFRLPAHASRILPM